MPPVAATPALPVRYPSLRRGILPHQSFTSRHETVASDSCVCVTEPICRLIWKLNTITAAVTRTSVFRKKLTALKLFAY
jgi:hypothetical protein